MDFNRALTSVLNVLLLFAKMHPSIVLNWANAEYHITGASVFEKDVA